MTPDDAGLLHGLEPTIARLRALPAPEPTLDWSGYDSFPVDAQTESDLIRLLALYDDDLLEVEDAQVLATHAWRALAQQGTPACAPQLVSSLAAAEDDEWAFEELPAAIARFEDAAIPGLRHFLLDEPMWRDDLDNASGAISALEQIATAWPGTGPAACAILREKLRDALHNPPELNAHLIASLLVLHDAASIPEIGAAFAHDMVDLDMVDWQFVRKYLEVGPKPPRLAEPQPGSGEVPLYAGDAAMAKLLRSVGSQFGIDVLQCFLVGSLLAIEMVRPAAIMEVILQDDEGEPVMFATGGQARYFFVQLMSLLNRMEVYQDQLFELPALPGPIADLEDRLAQTLLAMRQRFQIGVFLEGFEMGNRGVRGPEFWQAFLDELEARHQELDALADLDTGGTTDEVAAAIAAVRQYWSENYLRFAAGCMAVRRTRIGKQQFAAAHRNVGRNDPCPCGSGKKFKYCCLM